MVCILNMHSCSNAYITRAPGVGLPVDSLWAHGRPMRLARVHLIDVPKAMTTKKAMLGFGVSDHAVRPCSAKGGRRGTEMEERERATGPKHVLSRR